MISVTKLASGRKNFPSACRKDRIHLLKLGLWAIFYLSLFLRVFHLASNQWPHYNHDMYFHVHRVAYTQSHWQNPPLNFDGEANQEPLYYWAAAPFYQPDSLRNKDQINLAAFGLCVSAAGLCLLFRALQYLSSWLMRYVLLVYLGLTPAFVLASTCVGNDLFCTFFGICLFLFILRLHRQPRSLFNFGMILLIVFLGLLSKLSMMILFATMPFVFWRAAYQETSWRPTLNRAAVLLVGLTYWLGFDLWHAWSPTQHNFFFLYTGIVDSQRIPSTGFSYAFSGNFSDLLLAGQTTTIPTTPNNVRFSFPLFEYGNMLLGEYPYNKEAHLGLSARAVLLFGTFLPFGFLLALPLAWLGHPLTSQVRANLFLKSACFIVVMGLLMEYGYIMIIPQCCSADFRFQFANLPWIGYCVGRGLLSFPRGYALKILTSLFLLGYGAACLALLAINYIVR